MRHTTLLSTLVLGALLSMFLAAPVSAATTGTLCGQVTSFTAATAVTDGSITIDGTTEVIDSSAAAAIDLATVTTLQTLATADATTCVEITANDSEEIVDLDIAAQAEICGTVTADTVTGLYSVAGVLLPLTVVGADAELTALLDAAARAAAVACIDVTIDGTTGLITTVSLSVTLNLCGDATVDADSVALAGLDLPLSLLDAEARAALQLAIDAGADVCLSVVIDESDLVQANLSLNVDLCGTVTLDANGNFVVDGVVIDADLIDADAAALLELAASADGEACASVDASSSGGDTTVSVTVTIEICAEVTAITDNTITIGDVTFIFVGAADADIEVGDELCVAAGPGPTGDPVITDVDTTDIDTTDDGSSTDAGGDDDDSPLLPDTATEGPGAPIGLAAWLILASAFGISSVRRSESGSR